MDSFLPAFYGWWKNTVIPVLYIPFENFSTNWKYTGTGGICDLKAAIFEKEIINRRSSLITEL